MALSLGWVWTHGTEIGHRLRRKRSYAESEILPHGRHKARVENLAHARRLWPEGVTHMVGDGILERRRRVVGREIGGAEEWSDRVGWHGTSRYRSVGFGYVRDLGLLTLGAVLLGWGPRPTGSRRAGVGFEVLQVWLEREKEEAAGYLPEHLARDKHVGPRVVRVVEGGAYGGVGTGYKTHALELWYEVPPTQNTVPLDANLPFTTRTAGDRRGLGSLGL